LLAKSERYYSSAMSETWQTGRSNKPVITASGERIMTYYSPDTLVLLRAALDEAWELLPAHRKSEVQKSALAQRILTRASEGERDPIKLRTAALTAP
jgi:hypothetical protein